MGIFSKKIIGYSEPVQHGRSVLLITGKPRQEFPALAEQLHTAGYILTLAAPELLEVVFGLGNSKYFMVLLDNDSSSEIINNSVAKLLDQIGIPSLLLAFQDQKDWQGKLQMVLEKKDQPVDLLRKLALVLSQEPIAQNWLMTENTIQDIAHILVYQLKKNPELYQHMLRLKLKAMIVLNALIKDDFANVLITPEEKAEILMFKDHLGLLASAFMTHDIGKIKVPDEILNKQDKLTQKEYRIMKKHVEFGALLLQGAIPKVNVDVVKSYERISLKLILEHHERWDGKGYPRHVQGQEISFFGRLIAILDCWDAMRSDRCYDAPREPEEIKIELTKEKGRHFDPQMVDYMLKMADAIEIIDQENKINTEGYAESPQEQGMDEELPSAEQPDDK
ncbi:MAG: HD domain-containing phosphohydrolase [Candidatus Margulisiibacteriota bacterium]|jgi:response regulator RpfG family c-di-GMP phosphodiesterase